jgi:glutathione synthase/RimK-type ligase-like ATP-grasp enzyme
VLLATSQDWSSGEPGHAALDRALAAHGIDARWAIWDDDAVDWAAADLVAVRSAWDYMDRLEEFLAWTDRLGDAVLHGSAIFRWNTDKSYLLELADAGVPVVPTTIATTEADVRAVLSDGGPWMVKPPVGAGGIGVTALQIGQSWMPEGDGPWLVQPLVESVRTEGETSVFILDGQVAAQLRKLPGEGSGEFRVNEVFGGRVGPVEITAEARHLAEQAYVATEAVLGTTLAYARIDMLRHEGGLVVNEVEITEPGLYLDVAPQLADPFVAMVLARLGRT